MQPGPRPTIEVWVVMADDCGFFALVLPAPGPWGGKTGRTPVHVAKKLVDRLGKGDLLLTQLSEKESIPRVRHRPSSYSAMRPPVGRTRLRCCCSSKHRWSAFSFSKSKPTRAGPLCA